MRVKGDKCAVGLLFHYLGIIFILKWYLEWILLSPEPMSFYTQYEFCNVCSYFELNWKKRLPYHICLVDSYQKFEMSIMVWPKHHFPVLQTPILVVRWLFKHNPVVVSLLHYGIPLSWGLQLAQKP